MAFSQTAAKVYGLRTAGVFRTWFMGGGNGNGSGLLITSPTSIEVEVYGTFDSGTITMQYATDNATFNPLTTATITFTAAGSNLVTSADLKTGFYRPALTGTAGTASSLVINMIALGATDLV